MRVSSAAVHESGHAIVAAYLRVPFSHVTIRPREGQHSGYVRFVYKPLLPYCRMRSEEEIAQKTNRFVTDNAIVTLAARAAVEMPGISWQTGNDLEDSYQFDEEDLRTLAAMINRHGEDYSAWRSTLLLRAREIVAIPYIREAILLVAMQLELEYKVRRKGLPSKEVRQALQWAKAKFTAAAETGRGNEIPAGECRPSMP